ncbi:MAG TPA: hypothetical protein VFE05_06180 [Longimicrobiaceae bacterium]|jgi:hypothetical protein|nr:hypothetical protein [Longimicrobiaceae bacterium]
MKTVRLVLAAAAVAALAACNATPTAPSAVRSGAARDAGSVAPSVSDTTSLDLGQLGSGNVIQPASN